MSHAQRIVLNSIYFATRATNVIAPILGFPEFFLAGLVNFPNLPNTGT